MKQEVTILEERDLETTINQQLVKGNITDQVIDALKEKYGNLRLTSVDNKQEYLILKEARKEVRGIAIIAEKICKLGRESAVREQKLWLAKEKEIVSVKIGEILSPIDHDIMRFEDNEARIEAEEIKRKEELFTHRQTSLLRLGAIYENNGYTLGEITFEVNTIKSADNEIWEENILPKYKKVYDRIEAVKVQEEATRAAEIESLRLEKQQLEEQREAFRKEQQELLDLRENQLRIERESKRQEEEKLRLENQQKWDERVATLRALGMAYNVEYDSFVYEDVSIDNKTEISLISNEEWANLTAKITPIIEQKRVENQLRIDLDLREKQEAAIQKGIEDERKRVAEEARLEQIRLQQEEEQKQEELAKLSDKEKWAAFTSLIKAISVPELKSTIYKKKVAILKEKLEEIINL